MTSLRNNVLTSFHTNHKELNMAKKKVIKLKIKKLTKKIKKLKKKI